MAKQQTLTQVVIDCHFMVHFFFMKCKCRVTGHCARIELSLYLSLGLIGLLLMMMTMVMIGIATMVVMVTVTMAMVAGMVGVVDKLVVVGKLVVTMVSKVVMAMVAIMRPVDTTFIPMVQSLVPVHLERCSFQATHSQILPHSKH